MHLFNYTHNILCCGCESYVAFMSLLLVYFRGLLAPNPKDIPEPSHCRVFREKFLCVNVVKGV